MIAKHRITSLERWGMRAAWDFQPASCACVRDAGYTGVLVNGGSGIGPDMITPESLVESTILPDLMPGTTAANRREIRRRCGLLKDAGLAPWLCVWGVPGPDRSHDSGAAESNRFFDRRSKLEMSAKLLRSPDLFGSRDPRGLSWRGNRPLCLSHPTVHAFYHELYARMPEEVPGLQGVFFFPGDGSEPECCDATCPRCGASGRDPWGNLFRHVNDIYRALQQTRPGLPFYFCVWNQDHAEGRRFIQRFLDELDPGIGLAMSLSDNAVEPRRSGDMVYNQPWSTFAEPGELFRWTAAAAHAQGRPIMVMGEISQSEVWDPVCHNMPTPGKTLDLLRNAAQVDGADALMDFWGNRSPFLPHANHAAMREWLAQPDAEPGVLLARAAARHYGVPEGSEPAREALGCWHAWDTAIGNWALCSWSQRFSYAIGRDAARGALYRPLIPAWLDAAATSWAVRLFDRSPRRDALLEMTRADRDAWREVARGFAALADRLEQAGLASTALARGESANIDLAAELIVSSVRTVSAVDAWKRRDADLLRTLIGDEIESRERQLDITGRIGLGGGVNPILVDEDIQNMRLFLADPDFPETPMDRFHWTATPYST